MQPSDPEWYEALQGNPLKVPTFTYELKARIRSEALSTKVQSRSRLRHFIIISVGMICMLGFMLISPDLFAPTIDQLNQKQLAQQLTYTDSHWQEMIDHKYPDSHNEILYKQSIGKDRMLIFTRKLFVLKEFKSISLVTDSFVWGSQQWNDEASVSFSIGDPHREQSQEKLITNWGGMNATIFNGVVIDPQIASIHVVDDQNIGQEAQFFRIGDGYTYWFVAIPLQDEGVYNDGYKVVGFDTAGKALTTETYYYH